METKLKTNVFNLLSCNPQFHRFNQRRMQIFSIKDIMYSEDVTNSRTICIFSVLSMPLKNRNKTTILWTIYLFKLCDVIDILKKAKQKVEWLVSGLIPYIHHAAKAITFFFRYVTNYQTYYVLIFCAVKLQKIGGKFSVKWLFYQTTFV